jgi:hypothetical protein
VCINTDNLNKRASASTSAAKVGQWSRSDTPTVRAGPVRANDYWWYKLDDVWTAFSLTNGVRWFSVCPGVSDWVPPANLADELAMDEAEIDNEDVITPPCVAENRRGLCKDKQECVGKSMPNSPPSVVGCAFIADADVECCVDDAAPVVEAGVCTAFGVPGTCETFDVCASVGRASFAEQTGVSGCEKAGDAAVQCCTETKGSGRFVNAQLCRDYAGAEFPLAVGSLAEISVDFGFPRDKGQRCNTGMNLYTRDAAEVLAMAAGSVVSLIKSAFTCESGAKSVDAVLVYHETGPLANLTVMYGGLNAGSYDAVGKLGAKVSAGDKIGVANTCGILHVKLFEGRRTRPTLWAPEGDVSLGCLAASLNTKPADLRDPRDVLRCTMPAGAQVRHGLSFVEVPSDLTTFNGDDALLVESSTLPVTAADDASSPGSLGAGAIAGIVVAVLLFVALVVLLVVFFMRRRVSQA